MADIMLKDLESDQDLDHKALAKLIGGCYGHYYKRGCVPKKAFHYFCDHYYHHHHHGYRGHGHYKGYRKRAYGHYKKHWKEYC